MRGTVIDKRDMDTQVDNPAAALEHAVAERPVDNALRTRLAWQALCSVDAPVAIVDVCSPEQPLVFVNGAFCRLTGYDEAEVLGRNCRLLQHPDADPATLELMRRGIGARQPVSVVVRNCRRNGSSFWNALQLVPLINPDGSVTHYAGFQHDVSASSLTAHAVLSMEDMAPADICARFERAVADALREQAAGHQRHVLIVLCLVDDSAALTLQERIAVTSRLEPFLSPTSAFRFLECGAIALLTPVRGDETPGWVAEKAHDLVKDLKNCGAGLAEPFIDGRDPQSLLAAAYAAAQRAAASGLTGPCHVDPARDAHDLRQRVLLRDVTSALRGGQFRVVYQPIVELATGKMTGVEALLRWRHPTLGDVSTSDFIGHLERLPQIGEVTQWVLASSLAHVARWSRQLGCTLLLSVNVPAEVLLDDAFVDFALSAVRRQGVAPQQLEVELTERSLTSADGPAVSRLHELRKHGVRVAIDDFGTGWSSLAYLAQLPVDTLKVDLQFTRGVLRDRADAAISRMTVELARGLGLRCVAEGIETAEQLNFFAALNCDEGQGYFFARPLEVEALDQWAAGKQRHPGAPANFGGCPAATFGALIARPAPDKALLPCMQ